MLTLTKPSRDEAIFRELEILINGTPADALSVRVSAMPFNTLWPGHQRPLDQTELAAYLSFATDGPVEVVVRPKRPFSCAVVRPLSRGIVPEVENGEIRFTLARTGQYVLELDGPHGALHIFADPIVDYEKKIGEGTLIRFGAGEHRIGQMELIDHTTVLIDRDAVVYGSFLAVGATDIRILGEGAIDGGWEERESDNFLLVYDYNRCPAASWEREQMQDRFSDPALFPSTEGYRVGTGSVVYRGREHFEKLLAAMKPVKSGLHFYACKDVRVEGITLRDSAGLSVTSAGCEGVHFDNVKLVGMWRYNSDGIDFYNCRHCSIRHSFLRTFDDSIGIKGQIGWDTEDMQDVTVEGVVVWNDWGHSLEFGADSVASDISNITFRDCDIIHHTHAVLDVSNMDRADIHDVLFEDIRVEYSRYDQAPVYQENDGMRYERAHFTSPLILVQLLPSMWSDDGLFGQNRDITFRKISILSDEGLPLPEISLSGHDTEHKTKNVCIEGVSKNGERLKKEEMNLCIGDFTEEITVV